MKRLKTLIFILILITKVNAQIVNNSQKNNIISDINNDKINDSIFHNKDLNIFIFKYKNYGKSVTKKISFFKNYGNGITEMDFSVKNNTLIFKMSYAPKFLDNDILKFEYDKTKNDWILKSILIHRFSPIDPDLLTSDCLLTMKNKITITNSVYDDIEENITKSSKEYILTKKCKYKKGE
ncbi:hypothetical protein [Flavobacterium hydrophilum]|uniref:Uncharacterized protein n=1 Tax=Flavobacterium hydrophilum TaxID=2211445 RepID=A0A2V4CJL7_9FLAO|nr:hypothetical protein [Flavobacterium hydrophilum]PXY46054.1 hypothetical protein DMB68_02370 [Flavobacterium hydrophilum]